MTNILISDFVITFLMFIRILSAFVSSPIYGNQAVPSLVKVVIAGIIAYISFLTVNTSGLHIEYNLISIALLAAKEAITGLILGFAVNIVFYGISFAGYYLGVDIGLMMAQVFNPLEEMGSNVIEQIMYFFAMLIFFLIDGHHYIISAVVASFKVIPLGTYTIKTPLFNLLLNYSGAVFVIAIKIAAPIMVSFFLINIAEGIIARAIPQIQVFFITQPLKIGIGLMLLMLALPIYLYFIKNLLKGIENTLYELIRAMGA